MIFNTLSVVRGFLPCFNISLTHYTVYCIMPVRISPEDDNEMIARKIFYDFEVQQSCTIVGFETIDDKTETRGKIIWDRLLELDRAENYSRGKRKRIFLPNSNNAMVAHKIFRQSLSIIGNEARFSIWRMQ